MKDQDVYMIMPPYAVIYTWCGFHEHPQWGIGLGNLCLHGKKRDLANLHMV